MKTRGHYADPTAWEAIARTDRKPEKRRRSAYPERQRQRIGTYHAPNAKTKDRAVRVFRPENMSIRERMKTDEVQHNCTGT